MIEDPRVKFVGYRVPHPLKTNIEIKVPVVILRVTVGANHRTDLSSQEGGVRQLSAHTGDLQGDGRRHSCSAFRCFIMVELRAEEIEGQRRACILVIRWFSSSL